MGGLAHDLFILTELQFQLLAKDLHDGSRRMLVTGLVSFLGVVIGLACVPIGLVSLALFISDHFETSYALGFLFAAITGGIMSGSLGVIGWLMFRGSSVILKRSNLELLRNLRWIKNVLERDRDTRNSNHHTNLKEPRND